jgi:hypothetical protein
MRKTMLYRDAMVEITNMNIEPKWGLFNGAIGTVVDIIFGQGENPNEGHLPTVLSWTSNIRGDQLQIHVLHKKTNSTTDSLGQNNSFALGA